MATLQVVYDLARKSVSLNERFLAARFEASWAILLEDPTTPNNANRVTWANAVLDGNGPNSHSEYMRFLSNATIQSNGDASTDNDIQFVVNSHVDNFSNKYVASLPQA